MTPTKKKKAPRKFKPRHRQVVITHKGRSVQVDRGIAELVLALWQRGFRTISSCECEPGTLAQFTRLDGTKILSPAAWIGFETLRDAKRFQRLSRGFLLVPTAQDFAEASKASFEAGYNVPGSVGVGFSCIDIPAVLKAVRSRRAR